VSEVEAKPSEQPTEEPQAEAAGQAKAEATVDPQRAELEKAQADASRYKDQLLRTAADFDNFRKRSRRDVEDAQKKGLERAVLEMLPVSDNLERAVQAAGQATDVTSMLEGVRMVLKLLEDGLTRLGVERVDSVGQPFDPGLHEAVQHVESDAPPGTVVHEMVPGYRVGGKLLRAAMVAVARPRTPAEGNGAAGASDTPAN
jgi:molecular chaperone GrpE